MLLGCPSVGFDRAAYGQGVAGVVGQPSGSIEAVARDGEAGTESWALSGLYDFMRSCFLSVCLRPPTTMKLASQLVMSSG